MSEQDSAGLDADVIEQASRQFSFPAIPGLPSLRGIVGTRWALIAGQLPLNRVPTNSGPRAELVGKVGEEHHLGGVGHESPVLVPEHALSGRPSIVCPAGAVVGQ